MKKGFTLIELLGAIVLLGLIAVFAYPSIMDQVHKSKKGINSANEKIVLTAAKNYVNNHKDYISDQNFPYYINLKTLMREGLLMDSITDESGKEVNYNEICVQIGDNYSVSMYKTANAEDSKCQDAYSNTTPLE